MNKQKLISEIAHENKLSQKMVQSVINTLLEIITESIQNDESVTLQGFGSFISRKKDARTYQTPNGKTTTIPAHRTPAFRFSKSISDEVRKVTQESLAHSRFLQKCSNNFEKYPLIGIADFSEKEYSESIDLISLFCQRDVLRDLRRIDKKYEQLFFATLVEIAKRWKDNDSETDDDDDSAFWPYVYKVLTGDDMPNQILYNRITEQISSMAKRKMFYVANNKKKYYATILMHALSPKSSLNAFFDLCYNIFKKDLGFAYTKEDTWISQLVADELSIVLGKKNYRKDKKVSIGSSAYSIKIGLKCFATQKQLSTHFLKFIENIFLRINALYYGEPFKLSTRIDKCISEWWSAKIFSEAEKSTSSHERKARIATVSKQNISLKYLRDEDKVFLCIPAIRIDEENAKIIIRIFVAGKIAKEERIFTKKGELIITSKPKEYDLNHLLQGCSKPDIDIRAEISINDELVFDSGSSPQNSLKRDFILFEDDREILSQFNKPSNYLVYSYDIDELTNCPKEITQVSKNLYNIYPESGEMLSGVHKQVVFIEKSQMANSSDSICLLGAYDGISWISSKEKHFQIFKESIKLLVPNKINLRGLEIRTCQLRIKFSELEHQVLNDNTKVIDLLQANIVNVSEPTDISIYSFEKENIILEASILLLSELKIKFNKSFYYDDVEKKVTISNGNDSQSISWENSDKEILIPFNQGSLMIKIPYLQWKIGNGNWHNEHLSKIQWYKDFINDGDLLTFNMPEIINNLEVRLKSHEEKTTIRKTRNSTFELGRAIYAQKAETTIPVYFIFTDQYGNKSRFDLFNVSKQEHFTSSPIIFQNGSVFWNVENTFVGGKDSKLFLIAKQNNDKQVRKEMSLNNCEITGMEDGAYKIIVKLKDTNIFLSNKYTEIYNGELLVGEAAKYKFQGKNIILAFGVFHNGSKRRIGNKCRYIVKDLHLIDDNSSNYYYGTLCLEKQNGEIVQLDNMINEKGGRDTINPVRIELRDEQSCWLVGGWEGDSDFLGGLFYDFANKSICNIQADNDFYKEIYIYKFQIRDV